MLASRSLLGAAIAVSLAASGCAGSAEVVTPEPAVQVSAQAVPTATAAPLPTAEPAPVATAEPEPTAEPAPTPTAEPSPETSNLPLTPDENPADGVALPAFVESPPALTELVGTVHQGDLPPFDHQLTDSPGGSAIINVGAPDAEWHALHWRIDDGRVPMGISELVGREDGSAIWRLTSTWVLELDHDMVFTLGKDVCGTNIRTHDTSTSLFMAVVNEAQDEALGAWILTVDGPVPYEPFAELECAEFFP